MDKNYFKEYFFLERNHWWFKGRLEIIKTIFEKKVIKGENDNLSILNVGVATGATSLELQNYGKVISVEYDKDCCDFLKENLNLDVINASMTALPFESETFDIVCAFDVIEHIEDDELALKEAIRVLKTGGMIYLTVPMHMSLWSDHDIINHHVRRYEKDQLKNIVEKTGFKIEYSSFFNSILFLPIYLTRKLSNKKKKSLNIKSDFNGINTNQFFNFFLLQILKMEKHILNAGIEFKIGVSNILIGVK